MNRLVTLLLTVLMAGCAGQELPNASLGGTWVLDPARSDRLRSGGREVPDAGVTLIIENGASTVGIRRIVRSAQGEHVRELHYSTDGQEDTNRNFRGSEVKSRSRWSQGRLITEGQQKLGPVDAALTEVWTVAADGRTLTIESTVAVARMGDRTHKEVYLRMG
jgi:hypothetical protein